MTGLLLALAGALGVYLLYTYVAFGWRDLRTQPASSKPTLRARTQEWMVQAGLEGIRPAEFGAAMAALFVVGGAVAYAVFGGIVPALAAGAFAATAPLATFRAQRERRRVEARESWPRMIEEIRLTTTTLGRSIPQALFDVGRRGPEELRPSFAAAHREWLLSTDFERTIAVLRDRLADATADAVCETLLVAHELGGNDVDRTLTALTEDRIQDLQGRKDARAKQAGARFARRFVLIVPLGMAVVGLSIGNGRHAYQTAMGQALVLVAILLIAACWIWAGRIMRLPEEERVFGD